MPPMFQMIEIKYILEQKDREELLGPNKTYFNNEFIKTHLSVVFLNFYVTHFCRQFFD